VSWRLLALESIKNLLLKFYFGNDELLTKKNPTKIVGKALSFSILTCNYTSQIF
jgi:hypothetical protein